MANDVKTEQLRTTHGITNRRSTIVPIKILPLAVFGLVVLSFFPGVIQGVCTPLRDKEIFFLGTACAFDVTATQAYWNALSAVASAAATLIAFRALRQTEQALEDAKQERNSADNRYAMELAMRNQELEDHRHSDMPYIVCKVGVGFEPRWTTHDDEFRDLRRDVNKFLWSLDEPSEEQRSWRRRLSNAEDLDSDYRAEAFSSVWREAYDTLPETLRMKVNEYLCGTYSSWFSLINLGTYPAYNLEVVVQGRPEVVPVLPVGQSSQSYAWHTSSGIRQEDLQQLQFQHPQSLTVTFMGKLLIHYTMEFATVWDQQNQLRVRPSGAIKASRIGRVVVVGADET